MKEKDPSFVPKYKERLTCFDRERYVKKIDFCGLDPYQLVEDELSDDPTQWPKITAVDRLDYFVYQTNFATKDAMKAYKSLEAHNFFTSGLVFRPRSKILPNDRVLVLGKVHHSQKHSLEPLRLWLVAENRGEILTGHCTCMAGLSETCSHVAAVLFLLEYAAKAQDSLTCTSKLNSWLPPTLTEVPYCEVRNLDFSSASSRLRKWETTGSSPSNISTQPVVAAAPRTLVPDSILLQAVAKANPFAAVLSTYPEFCKPFETPDNPPKIMINLFQTELSVLPLEEMIVKGEALLSEYAMTEAEIARVEVKTRKQAGCHLWFDYRKGRITSSIMKQVCVGNTAKPAISTITPICYGGKEFRSEDTERGKRLEGVARKTYTTAQRKQHPTVVVKTCGLFIHKQYYFIGASPDGIVSCDCCTVLRSSALKRRT